MVVKVTMPRLSLTMKEGTVGKWYRKAGDAVEKGEPVAEILSEKATYDLEAPASGTIDKILVEAGSDAPVNAVLAIIVARGESASDEVLAEDVSALATAESEPHIIASPAAKRLARERGVDLSSLSGSGPGGRIAEADVLRAISTGSQISARTKEVIRLSGLRRTSSERLSTSFRTAPHSSVVMTVEASRMVRLRDRIGVSYTSIIVKAVALTLIELPIMNSRLEGDDIRVFEDINIGVAVATPDGLVVPVIQNADRKSVNEIDASLVEMSERARLLRLTRDDVTGGTFTVTNLGMHGVDFFIPIINPPEAAILALGKTADRAVVVDGKIEVRPMITLSLSFDHRIVDGAPAAQFLTRLKDKIEKDEVS